MRFLLDANLAPGLATRLRSAGYECSHITEFLPADAGDIAIAQSANDLQANLITKDADFLDLSKRSILQTALVWLTGGNMSNRQLMKILVPALPGVVASVGAGERIIEVR